MIRPWLLIEAKSIAELVCWQLLRHSFKRNIVLLKHCHCSLVKLSQTNSCKHYASSLYSKINITDACLWIEYVSSFRTPNVVFHILNISTFKYVDINCCSRQICSTLDCFKCNCIFTELVYWIYRTCCCFLVCNLVCVLKWHVLCNAS